MRTTGTDTITFSVRMDRNIKNRCEALYGELGINLTTAINVFLRQSLRAGGFPFDVRLGRQDWDSSLGKTASEEEGVN